MVDGVITYLIWPHDRHHSAKRTLKIIVEIIQSILADPQSNHKKKQMFKFKVGTGHTGTILLPGKGAGRRRVHESQYARCVDVAYWDRD